MHLLRSYAEFQKKLMKLADSGFNPFEFTEKYDEPFELEVLNVWQLGKVELLV